MEGGREGGKDDFVGECASGSKIHDSANVRIGKPVHIRPRSTRKKKPNYKVCQRPLKG